MFQLQKDESGISSDFSKGSLKGRIVKQKAIFEGMTT